MASELREWLVIVGGMLAFMGWIARLLWGRLQPSERWAVIQKTPFWVSAFIGILYMTFLHERLFGTPGWWFMVQVNAFLYGSVALWWACLKVQIFLLKYVFLRGPEGDALANEIHKSIGKHSPPLPADRQDGKEGRANQHRVEE